MNDNHILTISRELKLKTGQVKATMALLEEDATVPFIARYRKEATGSLDEVAVTAIRDRSEQLVELDKRRQAILKSMTERNLLTDGLENQLAAAETTAALEDIYLPYRPKRKTRASVAREKGLEPLAEMLLDRQGDPSFDCSREAGLFVNEAKGVETSEEALAGARDIIAEMISEDREARARLRRLFMGEGTIKATLVKGKEEEASKYKDYFCWEEPAAKTPSHRLLAMMRGEKEGYLTLRIAPAEEKALKLLSDIFVTGEPSAATQVVQALEDSYKRLLGPSMETEIRGELKIKADEEAIRVFTENLRELLLAPPLGQKNVLAIDPGFRTGCKVVCLDRQGKLLHNETIYPHTGGGRGNEAGALILALCQRFQVEVIAVGNGTAGRETESFLKKLPLPGAIPLVMVNESGASIYSASEVARKEFPDHDVTVRGAVSIGRRLMDPLAELVKIDPKSIGVGQYQHDVDQGKLKRSLDDVVMSCVNGVGVDVNTASDRLLTYVSGLGPQLADNIIAYRNEHGPFVSRQQLKKVPRLGAKAFKLSSGFLRIRDGKNPLDASAVHPESYPVVDAMASDMGCSPADLMSKDTLRNRIDLKRYITTSVGMPTLMDIMAELAKPGRDPREKFEIFHFAEGIEKPDDLKIGMKLPGIVTNVTAFGAFVDVGVHQDGLVHISQLADRFVKDPADVVKVHQKVTVTVMEVDLKRNRIALSMKNDRVGLV